jgi:diacylglycerol O-acyltransferase
VQDLGDDPEQMNDLEALMWRLESDPFLSSTFANVTFLDRAPDRDRLRRRMWRATRLVPRLRRRVAEAPLGQTPHWEDDPAFDLDVHLRFRTLEPGATEADVRAIAVGLAAVPFDRTRPLWEFTVIDGLPGGRAAMVQKMHHTITDGVGGIRMSVEFIDLERDAPEPPPIDDGPPDTARPPAPAGAPTEASTSAPAGRRPSALDLVSTVTRRGVGAAGTLVSSMNDLLRDPAQLAEVLSTLPAETAATARSLSRQLTVLDGHRSPLWTDRSLDRAFETFEVPFDEVKEASTRLGVSVNDVFVAAAAGGAGRYHRARGVDVDELRIAMPVSTRTDRSSGGNAFAPTRVLVSTDDDPRARLAAVHDSLGVAKTERAMHLTASVAGLANLVPQPLLVRLFRQQVTTVDFTASNVRAAPFDLYLGGALMESNYPIGPLGGTAWNITTMSYRGNLDIGVHVDAAAVADPAALTGDVQEAFRELIDLDRPRRRRRR